MCTSNNIYLYTDPDNESKFEIKRPSKTKATKTKLKQIQVQSRVTKNQLKEFHIFLPLTFGDTGEETETAQDEG